MNNQIIKNTHFCRCCKQELPVEDFYFNKRTQEPDYYCKNCRKNSSRKQHKAERYEQVAKEQRKYPVITEIKDKRKRMKLLLCALQTVAESKERKRRRLWEEEDKKADMPAAGI